MGQQLASQLDIKSFKCCHEMFDDSIDSEDDEETKKSKSLQQETTTNNINKSPIKQNKTRSTSTDNNETNTTNNYDNNLNIYMNKKTMELLLKIDDTFSPNKRKESEPDSFPDTQIPIESTNNNPDKQLSETNKRLQEIQNLTNPADVEFIISTHYATDLESDSDHENMLHLSEVSSIDEADRKEIAERKESERHIEFFNNQSKSNVYRQKTTSIWSPEDITELHNEMELQYDTLIKQNSERDVNDNNNSMYTKNLYRDESSEKWKTQEISNEKQQMRKEMLHLVHISNKSISKSISKSKLNM
eukprot:173764_1